MALGASSPRLTTSANWSSNACTSSHASSTSCVGANIRSAAAASVFAGRVGRVGSRAGSGCRCGLGLSKRMRKSCGFIHSSNRALVLQTRKQPWLLPRSEHNGQAYLSKTARTSSGVNPSLAIRRFKRTRPSCISLYSALRSMPIRPATSSKRSLVERYRWHWTCPGQRSVTSCGVTPFEATPRACLVADRDLR